MPTVSLLSDYSITVARVNRRMMYIIYISIYYFQGVSSLMACLAKCSSHPDCLAVMYDSLSATCHLYNSSHCYVPLSDGQQVVTTISTDIDSDGKQAPFPLSLG